MAKQSVAIRLKRVHDDAQTILRVAKASLALGKMLRLDKPFRELASDTTWHSGVAHGVDNLRGAVASGQDVARDIQILLAREGGYQVCGCHGAFAADAVFELGKDLAERIGTTLDGEDFAKALRDGSFSSDGKDLFAVAIVGREIVSRHPSAWGQLKAAVGAVKTEYLVACKGIDACLEETAALGQLTERGEEASMKAGMEAAVFETAYRRLAELLLPAINAVERVKGDLDKAAGDLWPGELLSVCGGARRTNHHAVAVELVRRVMSAIRTAAVNELGAKDYETDTTTPECVVGQWVELDPEVLTAENLPLFLGAIAFVNSREVETLEERLEQEATRVRHNGGASAEVGNEGSTLYIPGAEVESKSALDKAHSYAKECCEFAEVLADCVAPKQSAEPGEGASPVPQSNLLAALAALGPSGQIAGQPGLSAGPVPGSPDDVPIESPQDTPLERASADQWCLYQAATSAGYGVALIGAVLEGAKWLEGPSGDQSCRIQAVVQILTDNLERLRMHGRRADTYLCRQRVCLNRTGIVEECGFSGVTYLDVACNLIAEILQKIQSLAPRELGELQRACSIPEVTQRGLRRLLSKIAADVLDTTNEPFDKIVRRYTEWPFRAAAKTEEQTTATTAESKEEAPLQDNTQAVIQQELNKQFAGLLAEAQSLKQKATEDGPDRPQVVDEAPVTAEQSPMASTAAQATTMTGDQSETPNMDKECIAALNHFGKNRLELNTLTLTQKFYLLCAYWNDAKDLSPAKLRDEYVSSECYREFWIDTNSHNKARLRVKEGIDRGKKLLAKLTNS
ncbi:MAG: hypothetical protein HQ567_21235 [Candidatus Nealsonbacteria bacterium]|nr:hypothetical protein [Candidatus Nealsonbacteria bacterium]